jgi:hypothetical protein
VAKLQTGGGFRLMCKVAQSMICMEVHKMGSGLVRDDWVDGSGMSDHVC